MEPKEFKVGWDKIYISTEDLKKKVLEVGLVGELEEEVQYRLDTDFIGFHQKPTNIYRIKYVPVGEGGPQIVTILSNTHEGVMDGLMKYLGKYSFSSISYDLLYSPDGTIDYFNKIEGAVRGYLQGEE